MVLDCNKMVNMDYSAIEAFYHGAEALRNSNIQLKFFGFTVRNKKTIRIIVFKLIIIKSSFQSITWLGLYYYCNS